MQKENLNRANDIAYNINRIEEIIKLIDDKHAYISIIRCLLYTSPSPRDRTRSRMPSSA